MKKRVKSRRNTSKSNSRSKLGGAAIAAGGYGCVFKPALQCKSSVSKSGDVTKVLMTKYANDEMLEISKVRAIVSKIPNYNDYFLGLDATMCQLNNLSVSDKVGFDTKCGNLTKNGINSANVNMNLDKIRGINLPYGGLEFKKFFVNKKLTPETFINVNNNMIKLLKNGITPMNKLKLFHLDLKGPNILITDDYKARIIDWGLSGSQTLNEIPDIIRRRPFMYNAPFSICLFDPIFKSFIKQNIRYILSYIGKPISSLNEIRSDIKLYMIKWIYMFINSGGRGHYDYLQSLIDNLLLIEYNSFPLKMNINLPSGELPKLLSYSFLNEFIADELTEIVIQYTNLITGDFEVERYFNNSFKYNVDIWGFLTCYIDDLVRILLDSASNRLSKNDSTALLYGIRQIANKYMFSSKQLVNPISIDLLSRDLKELNNIFGAISASSSPVTSSPIIVAPKPLTISSKSRSKSISTSKSRTRSPVVPAGPLPPAKKTRKRKVVCDYVKKAHCRSIGKVCNEATGRCNKA